MRIDILTLFAEMFEGVLGASILGRARESGAVQYHLTDIRDYTANKHQKVDDRSFGGGPGMVMQCQPVWDAAQAVFAADDRPATRVLMTPQGRRLDQRLVEELAGKPRLMILAGHYEGIDERVIERLEPMIHVSVGDYVLTGGELAAMVLVDSVVRLLPGVLGDERSAENESFSAGSGRLLDYPHYSRPRVWEGMAVPEVLLNGDHAAIAAWRQEQSLQRTRRMRPDLIGKADEES